MTGAKATPAIPAVGVASYYGKQYHGRKTASGERFNMHALTAAHRTLPFGTTLKVTNLNNERSVVVRVNDRGPFKRDRILDLSFEAARRLQMVTAGTARVRIEPLDSSDTRRSEAKEP
jgi:rare lipoprotein A